MPNLYTLTGDVNDLVGGASVASTAHAYLESNIKGDDALTVTSEGGGLRLGTIPVSINESSGLFSRDQLVGSDSTDLNVEPGVLQYRLIVEYRDPGIRAQGNKSNRTYRSGWFFLNASDDIKNLPKSVNPVVAATGAEIIAAASDEADRAEAAAELAVAPTDTQVATLAQDPLSETGQALSATIATQAAGRGRPGTGVVFIGDSTTRGTDSGDSEPGVDGATLPVAGNSWPSYAGFLSKQRIRRIANVGIIGDTSAGMLARFDADVTARNPQAVVIYAGTNDATSSVTVTTFLANIRGMVDKARAAGIVPILTTCLPSSNSPSYTTLNTYNAHLRALAQTEGLSIVDLHGFAVNPATGGIAVGNSDGVHPNAAGHQAIGQYVADTLAPLFPIGGAYLTDAANDPNNLVTNGLMLGTAGASGQAPNWSVSGSVPAGGGLSLVAVPGILGQMQRFSATATAAETSTEQTISTSKWSPGEVLEASGRFTYTGTAQAQVWLNAGGSNYCKPMAVKSNVSDGTFSLRWQVPATATSLTVMLRLFGGTGTWQVGQVTVLNLSRLGLA